MNQAWFFPFGQPVKKLMQHDRTPKKVFVLGVYASAVHARWIGADGKEKIRALAVASEPSIFWNGEAQEAKAIIDGIDVPEKAGKLVPADEKLNGPSGRALDEKFLQRLGFGRQEAWLCDVVPYSCMNSGQRKAVEREYRPWISPWKLPEPHMPERPKHADIMKSRPQEILDELRESQAPLLVLLGDEPIKWFLRCFDPRWNRLSDFLRDGEYGQKHSVTLNGYGVEVLPLVHPRQAAKLGAFSEEWAARHACWLPPRK